MKSYPSKYLESALSFFKKEFDLQDVSCEIKFEEKKHISLCLSTVLGCYSPLQNTISIFGCLIYSRNELVKTLFHELAHYYQYNISKNLKYVVSVSTHNIPMCQSNPSENTSLIKDWYHVFPKKVLYYNDVSTENIDYKNLPHEIEAREVSKNLFDKWNTSEFKGKII